MKPWQILMIIISVAIIIYIWYPRGKENSSPHKMFRMAPRPVADGDDIGAGPPKTTPLKKRNIKVTITWVIATLNGLMLLVMQVKKIIH